MLQLCHCLHVVLWQGEPACDWAGVNDGQAHSTTSSNKVQRKDGQVKVIPGGEKKRVGGGRGKRVRVQSWHAPQLKHCPHTT